MPIPRSILTRNDLDDLDLSLVAGDWPAGLSGHFVVSGSDQRTRPLHAFFGDDLDSRLDQLDPELAAVAREVAAELE